MIIIRKMMTEMDIKARYAKVIAHFSRENPSPETELQYGSTFQLLVAVILSAQCTDKRVNQIAPELFRAYPDAAHMAQAGKEGIYEYIKSCSYPNNKASHLSSMARMLIRDFGGEVPQDMGQLQKLPGVGRKTANVIASVVWHQPAMPVDTHVFRVARRIGLAPRARTHLQVEKALTRHLEARQIPLAHHWLILHGRYVCKARKPLCGECGIRCYCQYFGKRSKTDS
jgi:endonuclease-3